jgi:predicted AlkP superfamily pyrophosphatase or phosphodiesterase
MLDIVGHSFGPRSHEVQDILARLDVIIGDLLDLLDRQVGPAGYVLALSADHGVATIAEQAKRAGLDAGRIQGADLQKRADQAIAAELGRGEFVAWIGNHEIYLLPGIHDRLNAKPGAVARILAALCTIPGVADAFAGDDLARGLDSPNPTLRAAALSYYPGRSGDFLVAPKPNWVISSAGTNHGSTNDYDRQVPVIFYGATIKPGKYDVPISPADIAPTLARIVGVHLDQAEGKPLSEGIIAPPAQAPTPPSKPSIRRRKKP